MSRFLRAIVAAGCLALAISPTEAASAAPEQTASNEQLSTCLDEGDRSLAVLFLVDTSQSLQDTDPGAEPGRVSALRGALRALDTVVDSRDIFVDFVDFGSNAERSFPDIPAWSDYAEYAGELYGRVSVYAERNNSEDTDYADAMEQAVSTLGVAPEGACKLLAWFTDGALDIDYQGTAKSLDWADPPIPISSERDEAGAELRAVEAMCRAGGFIDQLRPPGGDLARGGAFIAAVAFGDAQNFDLLQRIVTNTGTPCGERVPSGSVVLTEEFDLLTSALIRGVDPAPTDATVDTIPLVDDERCSAPLNPDHPGAFHLPSSIQSMRIRTEAPARAVVPVLLGPLGAGTDPIRFDSPGEYTVADGASVLITSLSPRMTNVDVILPDEVGAWSGDWELRFCTTNTDLLTATGTVEVLEVTGAVGAELRTANAVRRGRSGDVVVQLVGGAQQPLGADAVGAAGEWAMTAGDAIELRNVALQPDGTIRASFDVPVEFEPNELTLDLDLVPVVEVFPPGRQWPIEMADTSLGVVEIKDLPNYPIIDPPTAFHELDQENPTTSATLLVESIGPESGGCVELLSATAVGPAGGGTYDIVVENGTIGVGDGCSIELGADEQRPLELTIELDEEATRVAGKVEGELLFRSTSEIDPSQSEEFEFAFSARVDPLLIVESPDTQIVLGLLLLTIAAPLFGLYLYNFFLGSRIDVVSSPVVSVPVRFNGTIAERADGAPGTRPLVVETDIRAWPQEDGPQKKVAVRSTNGQSVVIEGHASPWPWGSPYATAHGAGREVNIGPLGGDRKFRRARVPMSTSRLWIYTGDIPEENLTDPDAEPMRTAHGVITIFPPRGRSLEVANELLQDAIEHVGNRLTADDMPVERNEPIAIEPTIDPQPTSIDDGSSANWDTPRTPGALRSDSWDGHTLPPNDDLPY